MSVIYFDNSSTTKIYNEALEAYNNASHNLYYNPAALHKGGLQVEKEVDIARKIISEAFPNNGKIVFTSGGTESDNMAIIGTAMQREKFGKHIITSAFEHHAVLNSCEFLKSKGFEITYIYPEDNGIVDINKIKDAIREDTILISIMLVNNEVGTVQNINEIRKFAKNAYIHTDAVQAFGKVDLTNIDADMISVSSHKIHGPKGVGCLYIKNNVKIKNICFGGGQENNLRSGTLNVPGIISFAKAVEIMNGNFDTDNKKYNMLREYLKNKLIENADDVYFNGNSTTNILNVSFKGIKSSNLMQFLEEQNIFVSAGSACNSRSTKVSYVLEAMNIQKEISEGSVRFSFSVENTKEEIDFAVSKICEAVMFFRKYKRK